MKRIKLVILLATGIVLLGPVFLRAQSEAVERPAQKNVKAESSDAKTKKDLTLADVTRVSTADVVRQAAKDMTKKQASTSPTTDKSTEPNVLEFHAASPEPLATESTGNGPAKLEKLPFKSVHGSVYGALAPNGSRSHETAGEVGATSKGGKTSVYVQSDRSSATAPSPH